MLLSYTELVALVESGAITGVQPGAIQGVSIDIRVGNEFMREQWQPQGSLPVDLAARESVRFGSTSGPQIMLPDDFMLAGSMERFNLPADISAQFCLKSSIARNGLEHLEAGWVDATFNDSVLTLELKNLTKYHDLLITPGMYIGQLKLFRHTAVPAGQCYAARGRYNGDHGPQSIKPE